MQALERQDAGVVCDAAVFFEFGFDCFVDFESFASLGDSTDTQLGRKVVLLSDCVVN